MRRFNGQRAESLQSPLLVVTQLGRDRDYAAATRSHCCVHRDGSWCSAEIERVFHCKELLYAKLIAAILRYSATKSVDSRRFFLYRIFNICFFGSELWNDSFQQVLCEESGLGSSIQTQGNRQRKIGVIPSNDMHLQKECMLRYACKVSSCSYPDPQARTLR